MLAAEIKNNIIAYAIQWMEANNINQADLARRTKINTGYLSNMLRGNYSIEVDGKDVEIADKWFSQLAEVIGYAIKKQYWGTVITPEFEMTIHELTVAKNNPSVITIINETGLGKTFAVDKFYKQNPLHTYKITVSALHKMHDIINEIAAAIGTPVRAQKLTTLLYIVLKFREIKMMGHQPLIIIDEAENLKLPTIQLLKAIYDQLVGYASIVLIGTTQLTEALERMRRNNKPGAPQFYRRIKAGIKIIPSSPDFKLFYEKLNITDKGLQKLLNGLCSNYGELHDYLEPALREADERDEPLTENLFRLMYNMPKY